MNSLQRLISTAVAFAAVTTVALAQSFGASPAAATSAAGTHIGNAVQLSAPVSGSLTSHLTDDWWVVFPSVRGGAVQVRLVDSTTATTCNDVVVLIHDSDGRVIAGITLAPNGVFNSPFSSTGSDRYFIETATTGCDPLVGHPATYGLRLLAGGGGIAPAPVAGTANAGGGIGSAWPP